MGRRPKRFSESASLGPDGLTENQGKLLAWVYTAGYKDVARSEVIWSAKDYLGRSPTGSEAATLTKRMQRLVDYELVDRNGRLVSLRDEGRRMLYSYAAAHPQSWEKQVLLACLERDKASRELEAYSDFFMAAVRHCAGDVEKLEALRAAMEPVRVAIRKRQYLATLKLETAAMVEGKRHSLKEENNRC